MLQFGIWMNTYIFFVTFVVGLVMGSFINCVAWRIAHGEDFIHGRSHCTSCGHTLSPVELIPVVSYLVQKGKSRCCKEKISIRYPLTELLMGFVFVALVWKFGFSWNTPMFMIFALLLLAVALVDLETGLIPNGFILAGMINFVLFTCLKGDAIVSRFLGGVTSGLSIAVPIFVLSLFMDYILKKESMGGGDIKLYFMAGLYFPIKSNLFFVLLSCIFGIIFTYVFQNIRVGDEENPMAFPFGPSIAAAALVSVFAAEKMIQLYMSLF